MYGHVFAASGGAGRRPAAASQAACTGRAGGPPQRRALPYIALEYVAGFLKQGFSREAGGEHYMKNRLIPVTIAALACVLVLIPVASQAFQAVQPVQAGVPTVAAPGPQGLGARQVQANPKQAAAQQATKEDHQQMMDQLHITSLRPGANARVVGSTNYDEAKANPYPDLPDPLTLKNGKRVTTANIWRDQRRPEIIEDFDREVYGRVPRSVPKVKWEVTGTAMEHVGDTPILTKTVVGHVDNSSYPEIAVDIQLSLSIPAEARAPVPVIMVFGGPPPAG